jgi:hypothetical protein
MPKEVIDYSNTIIYKIYCNNPLLTDIYIGHTTNFIKRKYQHKMLCNSSKKLKIYDTIRKNGGWDNWNMIEIAKYNCADSTEARIREQEHYDLLKPSLNVIKPISNNLDNVILIDESIHEDNIECCNNKYYCEHCHYKCIKKYNWEKHLLTVKHQSATTSNNLATESGKSGTKMAKPYCCEKCNKEYYDRTGLWRHKKKCSQKDNDLQKFDKDDLIKILLKHTDKLINVVENGTHNTTNSHNNNKTFNLSVFLNETCKDAMNISDFVSSIKVNLDDLEHTGREGYVQGITNIVLKNLNNIEQHMRPLHCSDVKREVLYIKDNNEWTKESEEKPILTKAIKTIANENIKQIKNWKNKYPDCSESDSRKNDIYLKIVSNSMNGLTKEEGDKNINKIISNVAKEVTIDKDIT